MEAIAAEQIEAEEALEPVAQTATAKKMFKYSDYLDLGEGAEECEHKRDGQCEDPEHFHAWCRLPNEYQRDDIRKKALAAKARKVRELSDPESDASVVLDQDFATIEDPMFKGILIEELLQREWAEDYIQAQQDVEEREEFEHIEQDREEYHRLNAAEAELPEEEQSDEYKRLIAHLASYTDAMRVQLESIQKPKREELEQREMAALVSIVRSKRVDQISGDAFMDVFNAWVWFVGTFSPEPHPTLKRPHRPKWEDIGHKARPEAGTMYAEAPEVIEALRGTFGKLHIALQQGSSGN